MGSPNFAIQNKRIRASVNAMLKFFKRTRNFFATLFLNILVWLLTHIWTSRTFVSIANIVSKYIPVKKVSIVGISEEVAFYKVYGLGESVH